MSRALLLWGSHTESEVFGKVTVGEDFLEVDIPELWFRADLWIRAIAGQWGGSDWLHRQME